MRPFSPYRARGFSLVELMVAMLIALIGTIIIFQVFEVSEGIKRSTTSGGDAQQNGVVALYLMEHDLRNGGAGFNDVGFAGCKILAYDNSRAIKNFSLILAPALICAPGSTNPGGMCPGTGTAGTSPDRLTVFYGANPQISDPDRWARTSLQTRRNHQQHLRLQAGGPDGDDAAPSFASNCSPSATGVGRDAPVAP
jgi:type IV pilus assembly protein PilW